MPQRVPVTPEQIRRQVDQIIGRAQSYPSFASLLDDLMDANGLTARDLAQRLIRKGIDTHSENMVRHYRRGDIVPSYDFIDALVTSNVLNLNLLYLHPSAGDQSPGDQRMALFVATGMIEVTPESICEWNREVLAGHRRLLASGSMQKPRWGDIMSKLLSFHTQGDRRNFHDIASALPIDDVDQPVSRGRLNSILLNHRPASENERLMLARYVTLDPEQVAYIEDCIATGAISVGPTHIHTAFTEALNVVLDKLTSQEITNRQLALKCAAQTVPGAASVSYHDLSSWRYGRSGITLEKLRSLVAGLKQFGFRLLSNPVTDDEIRTLITAAGFKPDELTNTTHQVIAHIDDRTVIKPLLAALRRAVDVAMPADGVLAEATRLSLAPSLPSFWDIWEVSGRTCPTGSQVAELLRCFNHFIHQNGFPPLSDDEVAKVVQVAERDHAKSQLLSHSEKLAERKPRDHRQPLSPSL